MTFIAVRCPHCDSKQIVKRGKTQIPPDYVVDRCAAGGESDSHRNFPHSIGFSGGPMRLRW